MTPILSIKPRACSTEQMANLPTAHHTVKYAFIDALRGYAVLFVITGHTGGMFQDLPFPLKKLTNFGWNGVQLFFLMSCVTLLLSWRSDETKRISNVGDFFLRRIFRIVPMYYLAGVFYFIVEHPDSGFDFNQALATILFINSWHPLLIPTVSDRWMVVPGGWSIGVEFTFYLLFPFIAAFVRSVRSALVFCIVAALGGSIANATVRDLLTDQYGDTAVRNFIYFWFPNQLPVFALGTVLYFIIVGLRASPESLAASLLRRYGTAIALLSLLTCAVVANIRFPNALPPQFPLWIPTLYVASLLFMLFASALACAPRSILVNSVICAFGQVSFSAYLLHFAVLHKLIHYLPSIFNVEATGLKAVFACFILWLATLAITYAMSRLTFDWIEMPLIGIGRRLIERRRSHRKV